MDPAISRAAHRAIRAVSEVYGVHAKHVLDRRRTTRVAEARIVAYYLLRTRGEPGWPFSLPEIARVFRRSHHTTVLYGVRRIQRRAATDPAVAARVKQAEAIYERLREENIRG